MEELFLALRLFLSGVFAFAAYGKLLDIEGTRDSIEDLGFRRETKDALAYALPLFELLLSFSLLSNRTFRLGALVSLAVIAVFTAYLTRKIGKDDCHCFGQASTGQVTYFAVFRNVFLGAVAVLIALTPSDSALVLFPGGSGSMLIVVLLLLGHLLLLVTHLLIGNFRSYRELVQKLDSRNKRDEAVEKEVIAPRERLKIGSFIPAVSLESASGEVSSLEVFENEHGTLLVLVGPTCGPCYELIPSVLEWSKELKPSVAVVSKGDAKRSRDKFSQLNQNELFLNPSGEFSKKLKTAWTPTAIFIGADRRIRSKPAVGKEAIEKLVAEIRNASDEELEAGIRFEPDILTNPDPDDISQKDLAGLFKKDTYLVYWDTGCSFCNEFVSEFARYESKNPVVLMTTQSESAFHTTLLTSPLIFVDDDAYPGEIGMHGTPSALLINERLEIISEPAVGAVEIKALMKNKV